MLFGWDQRYNLFPHPRSVPNLYLFFRYLFHGKCSTSVSDLVPPISVGCLSVKPGFVLLLTHTLGFAEM